MSYDSIIQRNGKGYTNNRKKQCLAYRCIALLSPFCVYIVACLYLSFINISINQAFFFPDRDISVRGTQPADVGSVAAVDGTHIAGGGRSLA